MRQRFATNVGVLAALIVCVPLTIAPVSGQAPSSAANTKVGSKSETTPRTPWGDPDLQGVWSYATLTRVLYARGSRETGGGNPG
jgi:hypothetical protein